MTFGPYSLSIPALIIVIVAAVWASTVLVAAVTPSRKQKNYGLRRVDIVVLAFSIIFGATWFVALLHKERATPAPSAPVRRCLLVETGQPESKVRDLVGKPDEIRSAEELRGKGSDLWIYRNERCVVHYLDGKVISVE